MSQTHQQPGGEHLEEDMKVCGDDESGLPTAMPLCVGEEESLDPGGDCSAANLSVGEVYTSRTGAGEREIWGYVCHPHVGTDLGLRISGGTLCMFGREWGVMGVFGDDRQGRN